MPLRWEASAAAWGGPRAGAAVHRARRLLTLLLPLALVVLGHAPGASSSPLEPAATPAACTLVASPSGSDSASGSSSAPFQTVQKLVDSLASGQTGCVRQGTYYENVRIAHGGVAGAPVTLTSYPGETATIVGRMYVVEGANYVSVTGLDLNGENPQRGLSPMIDANHVTFSYDDVTNDHTGICFGIGSTTWGWATGTLITHDRIHDCGQLPATNHQHGLYVGAATDTTIAWNLIYGNADRGIQLYPDAQHTTIDHNIIDDNGEGIIISGADGYASSYTNVHDNVISNATVRHDVESYWPAGNPLGVRNVVRRNCVWGGPKRNIDRSGGGFTARDNLHIDPRFVDGEAHDYEMTATSRCLVLVGDVQATVDGAQPVEPEPATVAATVKALAQAARR
ncbi:MAG TPA: right-handed parallel beta-helix repeat-containing protein [Mycobacterium sp.]|nr:right-handed parallel beta-helix repeat-containing protein [Mycobacterium sp.]